MLYFYVWVEPNKDTCVPPQFRITHATATTPPPLVEAMMIKIPFTVVLPHPRFLVIVTSLMPIKVNVVWSTSHNIMKSS